MTTTQNLDCVLPEVTEFDTLARKITAPRGPFISRAEWGARRPELGPGLLSPKAVKGIALHWPGMQTPLRTVNAVCNALRNWQAFHMDTNGWSDIAYQGAVDQDGNYYKLRGLRTQSAANGDAATNEAYGALLLVVAVGEKPSDKMVRTVRRKVHHFRELFPEGKRIVDHNEIRPEPTQCAGNIIRRMIADGDFRPVRKP